MTIDEVKKYFNTGYNLNKVTGMSNTSLSNWVKMGWVPILSQIKIEERTNGQLKARLEDVGAKK